MTPPPRPTAHADTARYYAAADVFAMPCQAGLEAEGLGIVLLEAAAAVRRGVRAAFTLPNRRRNAGSGLTFTSV